MEVAGKIVVVTGGASGIGKELAKRFLSEGAAKVVISDVNEEGLNLVAEELGCVAIAANVALEDDVKNLVEKTEKEVGPIDLFCSNAGVAVGSGIDSANDEWLLSWNVNVMGHVFAARYVVPKMIERGQGYLLNTASAAGLLNQIGGAAYGVTKHAAVGFGEWLAITYGHQGIKVSMLCPQAVRTAMTDNDGAGTKIAAADGMMETSQLADSVIEGLKNESFLILPHPEVLEYMQRKTSDYDRWIKGMGRFQERILGSQE